MSNLQVTKRQSFIPSTLDEAEKFAKALCKSSIVPAEYRNKPGDAIGAIVYGAEIGLEPLQAMQNIAMINGKPTVYGDALVALVQSHPDYEYIKERVDNTKDGLVAICEVKRKGAPAHTMVFSQSDAITAGLWGRKGPWTQYPKRMLQMRARGFACRDQFADVLKGMIIREEADDYQYIKVTPKEATEPKPHENIIDVTPVDVESLDSTVVDYTNIIKDCGTLDALEALVPDIRNLDKSTQVELRPIYDEQMKKVTKLN